MDEQNARIKNIAIIIVCTAIFLFSGIYFVSCLRDNREPTSNARIELEHASEGQRKSQEYATSIERRLEDSTGKIEELSEYNSGATTAIERTQERNDSASTIIERGRQLIEESRNILEAIRSQSK